MLKLVIAARTLDASSGLQLHGVVSNIKYIIQQVTVEYSVMLCSWAVFSLAFGS